jgi:hypothetical protein
MAEAIIKSDIKAGNIISIGFNKKKDEITIKVLKGEEEPVNPDEEYNIN